MIPLEAWKRSNMEIKKLIDKKMPWTLYAGIGKSKLAQSSILVPLFGYMIIFNEKLLDWSKLHFDIDVSFWRLYFLYFGFTFVGLGSIVFNIKCPRTIKEFPTISEYYKSYKSVSSEVHLKGLIETMSSMMFGNKNKEKVLQIIRDGDDHRYGSARLLEDMGFIQIFDMNNTSVVKFHDPDVKPEKDLQVTTHFYHLLDRSLRSWRVLAGILYGMGLALLSVPTIETFFRVVVFAFS